MAIQSQEISEELGISVDELLQRSFEAFLTHEIHLAEWDIADLRDRYGVSAPEELGSKIQNGQIYSHPAWEDLITWDNLQTYIQRLRCLQSRVG